MNAETTPVDSDEELSNVFGTGAEVNTPEENSEQSQVQESTQEDVNNSPQNQVEEQTGQTEDSGEQTLDKAETDERSAEVDQNVVAEGVKSDVDLQTALTKLDAAERSSSFWQSKFDQSQNNPENEFVAQIAEAAEKDPRLFQVLDNYFKGNIGPQGTPMQSDQETALNPPEVFMAEEIGDPNTESGRFFQNEVIKVAKQLQDTSDRGTDSRLRLLENDHKEKERQVFSDDVRNIDPSLSDGDVEELVKWMSNPEGISTASLVEMWKASNGNSKAAATRQEIQQMRENSSKPQTVARLGGEGKTPKNPNDALFMDAFGEVAPT